MTITLAEAKGLRKGDTVSVKGEEYFVQEVNHRGGSEVQVILYKEEWDEGNSTYFNQNHLGLVEVLKREAPPPEPKPDKPAKAPKKDATPEA